MKGGLIIIEGNIGAGKSTFAKELSRSLNGEYISEPDEGTNPYLFDYYEDPHRWAFEMQMFLLSKRFRAQKYAQNAIRHFGNGFLVMDRSYYGDICFANVQKKFGYFSIRDYETYLMHHTDMKVNLEPPAYSIFLDVSPQVCKNRISKRMTEKAGRSCESNISLDYLSALQDEINELALHMEPNTKVKHLDWSSERSSGEIREIVRSIASEIKFSPDNVYDFTVGLSGIGN